MKRSKKRRESEKSLLRGSGERPEPFRRLVALELDLVGYYDVRTGRCD